MNQSTDATSFVHVRDLDGLETVEIRTFPKGHVEPSGCVVLPYDRLLQFVVAHEIEAIERSNGTSLLAKLALLLQPQRQDAAP